jgi:hypothetical protein
MKINKQVYILINPVNKMKSQTIVSMSPVFGAKESGVKHYSTVVGTRNETGQYKVEDLGEVKREELGDFVKSYRRSKFVG